ncbi:MAG: hypothetical protein HY834_10080 [Devosia nanyangense]|uniref:Uncharacterized protein n=1 Tax=Devosia nanyangense TaxID=1228055 RepID=A0A933NZ28_9HYPH|nr:hypothetical protein [Devosia nanyangense]
MPDEIDSMRQLDLIFGALDDTARVRVFYWAASKYGYPTKETNIRGTQESIRGVGINEKSLDGELGDFADFYHSASPSDNAGRALVASYWLSETTKGEPFQSQTLNALLKDLGFQVGNITDALSTCMRAKPSWIVQTRKSGSSKQARKTYKITDAGKRRVVQMLTGNEQA